MPYEFHDTVHVEKRAKERGFTLEQAIETINAPASIVKTPPRRGNHGGMIWLFHALSTAECSSSLQKLKTMSAGSSQDTGNDIRGFVIPITEPPVVEIDTEATAAYVRLRNTPVARTEPYASDSGFVMLDFDAAGNVVGIEFVGQQEFSIRELIKMIPVQVADSILARTRYVSAKLQAA